MYRAHEKEFIQESVLWKKKHSEEKHPELKV